ncbi:MAG TPA: response regulator [Thermoanaerobaculia bacterium]|nr:response regulator [Thermoanaerobaculia bacterium]
MTRRPLRLLLIEDSDLDAAHLLLELKRGGFDPDVTRVETRDGLQDALFEKSFDAIISDYHLPRFSAPEALDIVRGSKLDVPFLVVSGAIGEETAVELMRAGAHDYLLKHRLARLAAAIQRELDQAAERRAKRRAEGLFQSLLRAAPVPAALVDLATRRVIDGSDTFRRQFIESYSADRGLFDLIEFTQPERIEQLLARGSGTAWHAVYYVKGVARVANVRCYTVEHEGTGYAYVTLEDVTEQHYLKAAFDAVPDPLLILSSRQTLLYANRAAEEVFGNLYFGMDVRPFLRQEGEEDAWWLGMDRFEEKRVEIAAQPYDATAVPFRFAGEGETSTILTLHNAAGEEELRRLATHDALTGVYNTRHFDAVLSSELSEGAGAAGPRSLQADQRRAGTRGRRRGADDVHVSGAQRARSRRRVRAPRRRRVRGVLPPHAAGGGGEGGGVDLRPPGPHAVPLQGRDPKVQRLVRPGLRIARGDAGELEAARGRGVVRGEAAGAGEVCRLGVIWSAAAASCRSQCGRRQPPAPAAAGAAAIESGSWALPHSRRGRRGGGGGRSGSLA